MVNSSRSTQTYFEQSGQILFAINRNIDTLCEQNKQTSEILTTLGTTDSLSPDEAFEKLLDNAASHIANPCLRSGFKRALEITIKQAQNGFEQSHKLQSDSDPKDIPLTLYTRVGKRQWHLLTKPCSRTAKSLFGAIRVHTITYEITTEKDKQYDRVAQNKTRIIFRPAAWLVRFGLAYELQLELLGSLRSWKINFHVYQPVPDDSLVFEFCRSGNLEGVQTLFSRKKASVFDVNSQGWTPLHVCF
jgi:hypothetical protein